MKGICIFIALFFVMALQIGAHDGKLTRQEAERYADRAWGEAQDRCKSQHEAMWKERVVRSGEYSMPFDVRVYGEKPSDGRSLYISMHGGGNTTKEVNDQQWRNQMRLYAPTEGVYISPRAAVDDWNMWFRPHVNTLFAQIINCAVCQLDVNPDKVYLLGYSAGGDGVYRMAPRMADYWAAASMMAGHPGEASAVNLRNIGFMVWMGENDGAYDRNRLAIRYGEVLDSLQKADPDGYRHKTTIVEGCGHWMNRADTAAIGWLSRHVRNPYPKRIVWRQEESGMRDCFYNLEIPAEEMSKGRELNVDFEGNTINVLKSDYSTFRIYLNDRIVDLSRKVVVKLDGKEVFRGKVRRKSSVIDASISKRMDKRFVFCSVLEISDGGVKAL